MVHEPDSSCSNVEVPCNRGQRGHGGERFGVTISTGQPVERLPELFEATCFFCGLGGAFAETV